MGFLKILYNKYFLALTVFVVYMIFFDQNNWFVQQERAKELAKLQENITFTKKETQRMNKELKAINSQASVAEQYAREKYIYKKPSEDVYLIINDTVVVAE